MVCVSFFSREKKWPQIDTDFHRFEMKLKCTRSAFYLCFICVHQWLDSRRLLLRSGMFGRKLNEYVFQRRAILTNLELTYADLAQLFLALVAHDVVHRQQMHRLTDACAAAHRR